MNKRSVIAVEADLELGQNVFDVCHRMGLDVRVFHDALDALMEAAKCKPGLMVFDANTAVLGTLDFADVITSDPQFKSVALVAIVGDTDVVARRRYSSRGIAVAAKRNDAGKTLRRELSRLLKQFVVPGYRAGGRACREAGRKGAA